MSHSQKNRPARRFSRRKSAIPNVRIIFSAGVRLRMSRSNDIASHLALLHEKLSLLEREAIIVTDGGQKFSLKERIAETRRDIAKLEAERAGLRPVGRDNAAARPGERFINVPGRNDFFTGREEILSRLHDTLKAEGRAAIKQAISGLGGIGKTQTAIEYAHRHAEEYACVLWTGAESESALTAGFASFAPHLGLPFLEKTDEQVAAVKGWLTQHPGWLLILDNADTPKIVADFLPSPLTGAVLLTSRATNFDALTLATATELDVLTPDEAAAFFGKRTGRTLADAETAAAKELAEELGHLPLALEQAAAFVKKNRVSFGKYLELYGTRRLAILKKSGTEAGNYRLTVETTWGLNFEQVEMASPAAADILRMSAFCAPDPIPFAVVEKGAGEISAALSEALAQAAIVNEVLSPLTDYSLITMDGEREEFSVHRLVQAVTRERLGTQDREWAERAVKATLAAFPAGDFKHWPVFERLTPHGTHLAGVIEEFGLETAEAGGLLNLCGYFLRERARYGEAKPLYERALAIAEKALGPEHPHTAMSLNNLAGVYRERGEYGKAEPLFERALAITEKSCGSNGPETAISLNSLAMLYEAQGKYTKALALAERSLAIRQEVFGSERYETAISLKNLAEIYKIQGNYVKARTFYAHALTIFEKVLGTEHPNTAKTLIGLATSYSRQGEYAKAFPLVEHALAIFEKTLGPQHPETAASLSNLAMLYEAQGEYTKAISLHERAWAIFGKTFGPEHLESALSLNNLALLYQMHGDHAKAFRFLQSALVITEEAMGACHPATATILNSLAALYCAQAEYEKAERLYERALAINEEAMGAHHPATATSLNNLAALYRERGEYGKALPLYERALVIFENVFCGHHPDVGRVLNNLGELHRAQAQYGKALPLLERALAIFEKTLGLDHPDTAKSLNHLAYFYFTQQDYKKASSLLERTLAIFEKTFGTEHPNTQNVAFGLRLLGAKMSLHK
jgi:tetratricopeptide (TPR) repeat protein